MFSLILQLGGVPSLERVQSMESVQSMRKRMMDREGRHRNVISIEIDEYGIC